MTASDIEPIGIAAEARRVLVDPRDGAPHLLGHDHQIAIDVGYIIEIERNEMRTRIDKSLGHVGRALCIAAAPSTTVDKKIYGGVGLFGDRHVELLDVDRAVGDATRLAEPGQRGGALLRVAFGDFSCVGAHGAWS